MNIKVNPFIFILIISLLIHQEHAHSVPTKWEKIELSMSELLDKGWQMTAHGTNRVAANSNSGGGFDIETFTFMLTKNGKHILCIIQDPRPPIANGAGCRKLN
jgi:hypothetical protein